MSSHYFKVVKSDMLSSLKDGDATVKAVKNHKYVYIDFDDDSKIVTLFRES